MPTTTDPTTDATQQPVYWFVLLERAVQNGHHVAAAEAQRELARLGVHVSYGLATKSTTRKKRKVVRT